GDEASLAQLLEQLRAAGAENDAINDDVIVPLILGLRAFWQGDNAGAAALLEPIETAAGRLSKYWEQRIAPEDTLMEAQLRAGRYAEAERGARRRLEWIALPRYRYWLGRAQLGLGRKAEAAESLRA